MFKASALGSSTEDFINSRRVFLQLLALFLFAVIVSRFFYLQIVQNEKFDFISEKNRINLRVISPFRGVIVDTKGNLLAENIARPALEIVPGLVQDIDLLLEGISNYIVLTDDIIQTFLSIYQLTSKKSMEPIPLLEGVAEKSLARLAENLYALPGVQIAVQMQRYYAYSDLLAHVVGYVGRVNVSERKTIDPVQYRGTYSIGKTGVEKQYEQHLLGKVGYEYVESNVLGLVQRLIEKQDAIGGDNVELFIDVELQQYAHQRMGNYRGAITAIDIETGGILAMISKPAFNTNLLVQGISHKDFNAIVNDTNKPLMNRNIMGQYPPGSVVKPAFGIAALDAQIIETSTFIVDKGHYQIPGTERLYRDWKRKGHGKVDLYKAIVESCDVFFYDIGYRMGINQMQLFANDFGFGIKTGIDLPYEKVGYFPGENSERNFGGHLVNLVIGQGDMLVTPLQVAHNAAIIARRGIVIQPRIVKSVGGVATEKIIERELIFNQNYWNFIIRSMVGVAHSDFGTARIIQQKNSDLIIASKTGTAQKVGIAQDSFYNSDDLEEHLKDHAWFMAFSPSENPKIAIAVLIENGESSARNAAPISRDIIKYWLEKQNSEVAHVQ